MKVNKIVQRLKHARSAADVRKLLRGGPKISRIYRTTSSTGVVALVDGREFTYGEGGPDLKERKKYMNAFVQRVKATAK